MGFRFRKSIRIVPGVRINLSSRSASVSLGGPGLRYTVGSKGTRTTVGLPGTGISYSTFQAYQPAQNAQTAMNNQVAAQHANRQRAISPSIFKGLAFIAALFAILLLAKQPESKSTGIVNTKSATDLRVESARQFVPNPVARPVHLRSAPQKRDSK